MHIATKKWICDLWILNFQSNVIWRHKLDKYFGIACIQCLLGTWMSRLDIESQGTETWQWWILATLNSAIKSNSTIPLVSETTESFWILLWNVLQAELWHFEQRYKVRLACVTHFTSRITRKSFIDYRQVFCTQTLHIEVWMLHVMADTHFVTKDVASVKKSIKFKRSTLLLLP